MTTEFVRLDPNMTVGDALTHTRVAQDKESIYACYVMEPTERTCRALSRCAIWLMSDLTRPLPEVMRRKRSTVNSLDDQEVVAKKIAAY
jgi:magnesium transporter